MQFAIDSGDRKLVITAAALVVALATITSLLGTEGPRSPGYPSSYSAASDGAKAAYLTLQGLGYPLERWLDPPQRLPTEHSLLVLADPFVSPSQDERRALRSFVERGGRILATGAGGAQLLPDAAVEPSDTLNVDWKEFPALLPTALSKGAAKITLVPAIRWAGSSVRQLPLYGDQDNTVAVVYEVGQGQVLWLAASTPLTNAGIQRDGNLELLLNFAGSAQETKIFWDEYFHGQGRSLAAYFARTPLPWGLAQIALVLLLAVLAFSRHSGPVHPLVRESRLSPLEFIDTLGGLYQRAQATHAVVEIAYQRFRFLLTGRLGMPPNTPDEDLEKAAHQRLGPVDGLGATLQKCRDAQGSPDINDRTALRLVQALHHYSEKLALLAARERKWKSAS